MSSQDLDKAIKSINESASRANTTTDFFNSVLDGGKTELAQNPLTGAIVPSVQKAIYDQYKNDVSQIQKDVADSKEAADRAESASNAVWNRRTVYAEVNASFGDYQDDGRALTPRLSFGGSQYLPMFDSSAPVTFTGLPVRNGDGTITVATDKGDRRFSRVIAEAVAREDIPATNPPLVAPLYHTKSSQARKRYEFVRIGASVNNVIQSVAFDDVNGYVYTQHVGGPSDSEYSVINRYSKNGNVKQTADVSSATTLEVGHQGLAIQQTATGVKFWGSAKYGVGNGNKAVRFDLNVSSLGANGATVENVETFQFFPTDTSSQSSTPCVSYCGRYLVVEKNATAIGAPGNYIRVFELDKLTDSGDYSNKYFKEFFVSVTNGAAKTPALQSMACDGSYIYILSGNSSVNDTHTLAVFTMDGELVREDRDFSVGKTDASGVGSGTFYEPEGMAISTYNGIPTLFVQIAVGDQGARGCFVYGLGIINGIRSQPGDTMPGFLSVAGDTGDFCVPTGEVMSFGQWSETSGARLAFMVDQSNRMLLKHNKSLSIRPVGNAGFQHFWDSGAGHASGRFDAGAEGIRHVFYKSRSPTIGESVALKNGDRIGILSFTGDDGAADYSSMAGANGAEIVVRLEGDATPGVMPARMEFHTNNARRWQITEGGNLNPATDNSYNIGNADSRVKEIFCANGTINTSDQTLKTKENLISDEVLDAWGDVSIIAFQWLDAIKSKGKDMARIHYGIMAQQVRDAFIARGQDATRFGLLCYDKWGAEDEVRCEETGAVLYPAIEAGERWGIRPDQCLWLEAAYQRRRCDRIEARLAKLEA
ncbi:MAG: tail fiber domain-containing protein [Aeromonadaceae bacterium]